MLTINFFFLTIRGQSPADAEFNFLDHGKRLDMYGVDLHKAKVSIFYHKLFKKNSLLLKIINFIILLKNRILQIKN